MKRRLIRKSSERKETYIPVQELDEADIKFNRCPICKGSEPLQKDDGFKYCPNCRSKYKTFDGNAYIIQ